MTDVTTLERWLSEAEGAYHRLMISKTPVRVSVGDRWVEYTPAKAGDLSAYIATLKRRIADAKGQRRGPAVSPYVRGIG